MAERMKNEILYLFGELYGYAPFDYQAKILLDNSKRIAVCSGRQIGKTTLAAIKAIYYAISGPNRQILIVSKTERQAGIMFRKIRHCCQHPLIKKDIVKETERMMIFSNGSEIHSLPGSNPDSLRGYSPFRVFIDEAASVKEESFVVLQPSVIATKGGIEMYSTPKGKVGRFYRAFEGEKGWSLYKIPSRECPLITEEDLEADRAQLTEVEFKQEYEAEFVDFLDTFISLNLYDSCVEDIPEITKARDAINYKYFLGVDIARYGTDETVYIVSEVDKNDNAKIVFIRSTSKKPITDVIGRVKELHNAFNFSGIYIDETGLGAGAADSLIQAGLPIKNLNIKQDTSKVFRERGVQFTLINKEALYKNLKLLMEQGRIKIPYHDKLRLQTTQLIAEYTEAGHLKLSHPERGHDDFPDALALSVAALIKKNRGIPLPMGSGRFR